MGRDREDFTRIHCAIFVERDSQKKIVIGKGAARLKDIGIQARQDIEDLLGHRCHLELFVKVEKDWRDQARTCWMIWESAWVKPLQYIHDSDYSR